MRLSIPVMVQNLLIGSFGLVDALMIGQLGDLPIAAVGMAVQWGWLMHIFHYGMTSGASVFIAQYWGAGDHKGIRRAYGVLLILAVVASVVMMLLALITPQSVMRIFSNDTEAIVLGARYLRIASLGYAGMGLSMTFSCVLKSTEQVTLPLTASACGVVVNTVLNYALIFGNFGCPALGVEGAAIATVIASWTVPAVQFLVARKRRMMIIAPLRELLHIDAVFFKKYLAISMPALANEIIWSLGTLGYSMVFGRMGTSAYAALTIFRTIEGMFFAAHIGFCHASAVLVGKEIGAGNIDTAVLYAKRLMIAVPILCIGISLVMILTRSLFVGLYSVTPAVAGTAMALLLLHAINMPIRNISFMGVCGIFRPGGDTRIGIFLDLLSVWMMALPITALCGLVFKLDFLLVYAIMLISEDWLKSFLCVKRVWSLKWIKPVVDEGDYSL